MGVVKFLYHPDNVLTAADLESLALDLLAEIPIPGVEGCGFDSGDRDLVQQTKRQGFKLSSRENSVRWWRDLISTQPDVL